MKDTGPGRTTLRPSAYHPKRCPPGGWAVWTSSPSCAAFLECNALIIWSRRKKKRKFDEIFSLLVVIGGLFWWLQHITVHLCRLLMALSYFHFSFTGKIKYFVRLTDEDSCSVLSVIWKMKIYCSQGGGFFWTDLYFILSCQKRDRLMASGIYFQCWFCFQSFKSDETDPQSSLHWEKEVASVPALSSELPARVSGSTIHPLPAHPVSWQSGPESPFLPM